MLGSPKLGKILAQGEREPQALVHKLGFLDKLQLSLLSLLSFPICVRKAAVLRGGNV